MITKDEIIENRKVWLEALRSGKYKQCRYNLRNEDKFCCLGVAGEIFNLSWYDLIYKKLGLSKSQTGTLIFANDHLEKPFEYIADMVEFDPIFAAGNQE